MQDGEYVGIVVFNGTYGPAIKALGTAYILSDLVQINSETRKQLVDSLPKEANGATSIGKGERLFVLVRVLFS